MKADEPRESWASEIGEAWLILTFLPLFLIGWGVRALWWLFIRRGR